MSHANHMPVSYAGVGVGQLQVIPGTSRFEEEGVVHKRKVRRLPHDCAALPHDRASGSQGSQQR
jgi:hypothetical protein